MSQLNFFVTEIELYDRLVEINKQCSISLFKGRFFETIHPQPIQDIMEIGALKNLTIWSNNNFCIPTCSAKGLGKHEGLFLFDSYHDPIIEMTACTISDKVISPGRIYYKNGWIKDPELDKFHTIVCKKIKRIFGRGLLDLSPPFKVSKEIQNMMSHGYKVELGVGGVQLPES